MLSILIVNWNTRDLLRKCLLSIRQFCPSQAYETIVVDNASADGSADMVAQEFPEVHLIANASNVGYAAGNNQAFSAAKGDYLLTLNPDTEFVDLSLDKAISVLDANPRIGVLGARQVSPDGSTQSSVRGFPTVLGILGDLIGVKGGALDSYRLRSFDYDTEQIAPQPMGTFLLFRRKAIEDCADAAHPLDERFPIFFNEVDLLYRLSQCGWQCLYSPEVRVLHHGGEGTRQVRKPMIWESHNSLVRYFRKHHERWWNAPAYWLVYAIVYLGALVRARGFSPGFRS